MKFGCRPMLEVATLVFLASDPNSNALFQPGAVPLSMTPESCGDVAIS